jgi:phenylalanyl-tRNA synthetase alpha chain
MKESNKSRGHYHPLTIVIRDIERIFREMGFSIADGPEIETEHYNFDALNIPEDHPARDLWDTFWLEDGRLLRTHTSPVQVRYMEKHKAPFGIVVPGKVYRYEATDATHEAQFYQIEGLLVGEDVSLAHLKGVLEKFFSQFFGRDMVARLRPSYFPFVEPGVEVDMSCFKCERDGAHCSVCKGTGWVEIMGAGMVHPKVLDSAGIDSEKYSGFAFGTGVERLAMLRYGIEDVRLFHTGDLRVVNQF